MIKTMHALVYDGALHYETALPLPSRKDGESLIRVSMAGICNTDREILRGYMGFRGVPGHEFVGIVEESSDPALNGVRVVGEINCPCGFCELCSRGLGKHCSDRTVVGIQGRDGAFAEYLVLPERNLHVVPDNLSDEEAVFTEPLAAAFEILESVHIAPEDRVLVIGAGKLGKLVAMVLQGTGCRLIVVVAHEGDRAFLASMGIVCVTPGEAEKLPRFDLVVECSGSTSGFTAACNSVRPRGTIVQKSTYADSIDFDISRLVVDEVRIVGSRCGPFAPALRALAARQVRVDSLVSRVFPLGRGEAAFAAAAAGEQGKILFKIT